MLRASAIVLATLPACLSTPTRPLARNDAGADSQAVDAAPDGTTSSGAPTCVGGKVAVLYDDFNAAASNPPCGHNGAVFGDNPITRTAGVLRFDIASGANGGAYCTWNPFPTGDLIVKLGQIPTASFNAASDVDVSSPTSSASTYMQVVGGAPVDLKMIQNNTDINRIDWLPQMIWWRYRIVGAQQVATDYSTDGMTWTALGSATWPNGTTSNMELTIGVTVADATGGVFDVDEIYTCQ